ncbi:hypothetical protein GCM10009850_038690 [Nonomuraea monospora]|uniref:Uncharacterized protein n=1 Tax=Nonomuraea monospora TaxID=568818 RepID=A0ABN3CG81_9ACTN
MTGDSGEVPDVIVTGAPVLLTSVPNAAVIPSLVVFTHGSVMVSAAVVAAALAVALVVAAGSGEAAEPPQAVSVTTADASTRAWRTYMVVCSCSPPGMPKQPLPGGGVV